MNTEHAELDQMQLAYKVAVEAWIATIRNEEGLASANHSVAQVDLWEQAHDEEEEARAEVKSAKAGYEAALRQKFFHF